MITVRGTVAYSNPTKRIFFVAGKNADGAFEKFYSAVSYIKYCEVELTDIVPGLVASWTISPTPPKKEGGLRVAQDVAIYKNTPSVESALDTLSGNDKVGA